MARPPEGVPSDVHAALLKICAEWEGSEGSDVKVVTLTNTALELFKKIGWASEQLLPNDTVGRLAV